MQNARRSTCARNHVVPRHSHCDSRPGTKRFLQDFSLSVAKEDGLPRPQRVQDGQVRPVAGRDMLRSSVFRTVDFCTRHAWLVIVAAVALAAASTVYVTPRFAIKTDVTDLFPSNLPWTQRAFEYMRSFPQPDVMVVVDAPTPELVDQAATRLVEGLTARRDVIRSVHQPQSGEFFERNGLLYLPTDEVARVTDGLLSAGPLLQKLAADPSLRGSLGALSLGLMGVQYGQIGLDDLTRPMTMAADTVSEALAGNPTSFSWRVLTSGKPAAPQELRRFIELEPLLDFTALEPGRSATNAIAQTARDLQLAGDYQARVRLTGIVPINDDGFATLKQNAALNIAISVFSVLVTLWLALHSLRIIVAVVASLIVGLPITAALGLMLVGALNLISVAFFVLFVGLGVDFGLQFCVRYRAERHDYGDLRAGLRSAARKAGVPLALAAAATALGFASFVPTTYRGLAELGQIAGCGMIIAFLTSITLLPALTELRQTPGEPHPMGFAALVPVDRFIQRFRMPVIVTTLLAVVLAAPLLLFLPFDFNPLHLRNPKVESVATFLELRKDPQTGANAIEVVADSLAGADVAARRLASVPEVSQANTLSRLIPADQYKKLALIQDAAEALKTSINPTEVSAPPTDQQNVAALASTADGLSAAAASEEGPGAEAARRLSELLRQLARAEPDLRSAVEKAVVEPLRVSLNQLRQQLDPEPVTADTIPTELKRDWVTADGKARVEVLPKGDPDDTKVLRSFVSAVLAIEPTATGPAVLLFEAGNTVVRAFVEAGIFALVAIAILLWIALRRIADVLLTLLPLLVAVGVAFKIYYIMAWRSGKTALVQSTLTRAVIFSAMTQATAFGSLWLSSDPGTSSMGKLMALSLMCTMTA